MNIESPLDFALNHLCFVIHGREKADEHFLRTEFAWADSDQNGVLDADELNALLTTLAHGPLVKST